VNPSGACSETRADLQDLLDAIDLTEDTRFEDVHRRAEFEERVHDVGLHVVSGDKNRGCPARVARLLQRRVLLDKLPDFIHLARLDRIK